MHNELLYLSVLFFVYNCEYKHISINLFARKMSNVQLIMINSLLQMSHVLLYINVIYCTEKRYTVYVFVYIFHQQALLKEALSFCCL
jgi:hypothetical protein